MRDILEICLTYVNKILKKIHIQKYEGTLANITGDALFVFFGAPDRTDDRDHALRFVRMAVKMKQKMQELQKKWFSEGIEYPLQIRCGINTGMVTVGSFGISTTY